jgi:hypothetical protein
MRTREPATSMLQTLQIYSLCVCSMHLLDLTEQPGFWAENFSDADVPVNLAQILITLKRETFSNSLVFDVWAAHNQENTERHHTSVTMNKSGLLSWEFFRCRGACESSSKSETLKRETFSYSLVSRMNSPAGHKTTTKKIPSATRFQ